MAYHGAYVARLGKMWKFDVGFESIPLTAETLRAHDCTLIVTDHSAADDDMVVTERAVVLDTRNTISRVAQHSDKIVPC